jgi:hypothetical protein
MIIVLQTFSAEGSAVYYSGFHMSASWERSHLGCQGRLALAGGTPALLKGHMQMKTVIMSCGPI